jgi:fluoride ion exporter CrcB/FEX
MLKSLISGFIAGLLDVLFYIDYMNVFATISYHILKIYSIPLGIILHLIASTIIFVIAVFIIEKSKIKTYGFVSYLILGIMVGSSTLALFSLPVHLLIFPIKITLVYVIAHIFYGIFGYVIYWILKR